MKNDRKLLTELTQYYIDRYNIRYSEDYELRTLRQKIVRLLQKVPVGNTCLYDAINESGGARSISVEEFEHHCFLKWAEFLVGNELDQSGYVEKTNKNLIEDLNKHKINLAEIRRWEENAPKEDALRDKFIEEDDPGSYMYDDYDPTVVTDNELAQKGHEMMLEAIFAALVGEFDWNRLKQDMRLAKQYDSNYGSDNDGKIYRAKACLNDYRNYCDPKPDSFTAAEPETAATDE